MKARRIVVVLLILCLLLSLAPFDSAQAANFGVKQTAGGKTAASDQPITRAAWISELADACALTVEKDSAPDNYYSDLTGDEAYFQDVLAATNVGALDIKAGMPFEPEKPATRAFAARSLNACLGLRLDEGVSYSFSEAEAVDHPDDLQIAIERGWFALQDGKFLPDQPITAAESEAMLADAKAILADLQVDENYNSIYQYKVGVIEIPEGTLVASDADDVLHIENCPVSLKAGDLFVAYFGGIPCAYSAKEVTKQGTETIVKTTPIAEGDVLEDIDAQGVVEAEFTQFVPYEGTEVKYINEITQETYTDPIEAEKSVQEAVALSVSDSIKLKRTLSVKKKLKLTNAISATVEFTTSDPVLTYKFNLRKQTAEVYLTGRYNASIGVEADLAEAADMDEIQLALVGVKGVGGLELSLVFELTGSGKAVYSGGFTLGMSYSRASGFCDMNNVTQNSFSLEFEAGFKAGFQVSLGVNDIPDDLIEGYCYFEVGPTGKIKLVKYPDDQLPKQCVHSAYFVYMETGIRAAFKFGRLESEYTCKKDIWTEKNSPIRVVHHYEDGVEVPSCTRENPEFDHFFTNSDSRWGGGWSGRNGAYGLNANGEPVQIYTYSLDSAGFATITGYSGNASALIIPQTVDGHKVVAIGNGAFSGKLGIRSVSFPDTVTTIGADAFNGCTNLSAVQLPSKLVSIQSQAFCNCSNLQTIDFPSTLTSIGTVAFRNCTSLRGITLPANLTEIGAWAFRDCDSITSVNIPKGITSIPNYLPAATSFYTDWRQGEVFYGCDSLKTVTFDEGISVIPRILNHCPSIEEIVIPDTVTTIETRAFRDCTGLKKVVIPSSVTTIGPIAFMDCRSLSAVQLPPNLKTLGAWAFYNCDSITEICIPAHITSIPELTFTEAYDYMNYPLTIHNEVFRACDNLTKVTFAKGIQTIPTVLNYCTSLKEVEIPDTVVTINNSAFENCTSLKKVTFPDSLGKIGSSAFCNCSSLKKVTLNQTLKTLETKAFANCSSLESIVVPDSLEMISSGVFSGCTSLKSAKLPDGLSAVPTSTFANCTSLTEFKIPANAVGIGNYAFQNCTALKTIIWGDQMEEITKYAFENCSSLESVTIPYGVTTLGEGVFSNCDGLTSAVLSDSVSKCGAKLFYDCDVLKNVTLSSAITAIPDSMFEHCDVLESVVIPRAVASIGSNVFKDCVKFTSLTIPRTTTSIRNDAVSYPDILTIYGVAGTTAETYAESIGATFVAIDKPIRSITLNQSEVTLQRNGTLRLLPTFDPVDFTDEVVWKSSDTNVATVDSTGLVRAVSGGTATISVVSGNLRASCTVTVLQPVTSISLNKSSVTLDAGSTFTLTASIYPGNASNKAVTWSSSDPSVAAVTQDGVITALKKGTATITCVAQDGSGVSGRCAVTVPNNVITVTDVKDLQSAHPYANNCSDIWIYQVPGASSLQVTFSGDTSVEQGSDYIYLFDGEGNQIGAYTGTELAGQTITVPGCLVKIKLVSDSSFCEYGFAVTEVKAVASEHTHTITAVARVDATCTQDGTEAYWKCSICGMMFSDAQGKNVISAPAVIKATGHKWDAGTVTKEPTDTTEGVKTFTCTVCGETRTESIPKLTPQPTTEPTAQPTTQPTAEPTAQPTTPPVRFSDVPAGAYYAEPVSWAVNHTPQITNGTSPTTFSPDANCTRGQIVTFLWRAKGQPEPKQTNNPFADVNPNDYYYKAVLWAVEQGITNGTDATHFSPNASCTRGQAVTFLWRAENKPAAKTQRSDFKDVQDASAYYYTPVLWAVENGITNGTGNGMFSPNMICLREQIVTFLYRDLA